MTPFLSTGNIRIWGAGLSLLFSGISVGFQNVIGRDSIRYVESARVFLDHSLSAAVSIFPWPFYSMLFGLFHQYTGIPLELSARIVDAILIAILVDAFFRLYQETVPETKKGWIAMVTILAFAGLNDYRYEIIRDWGFLAFSLRSFVYLVRTFKTPSISNSACWQMCILIAFLFRIEAIVLMCFAPFVLLFRKDRLGNRIVGFAIANAFLLAVGIALTNIIVFSEINIASLGRLEEIISYTNFSKSIDIISKTTESIKTHVIPYHGSSYAITFLLSGILGILIFKTFAKIGIIFNGILLFGYFRSRPYGNIRHPGIVAYFTLIAFFIVYVYFLHSMIVAGRYILLTSILVLIFVSYFFEQMFSHCIDNKKTRTLIFVGILFIVNTLTGLFHSSNSKEYLKIMGEWTSRNIPKSELLVSNDARLYYYSGQKVPYDEVMHGVYKPKEITQRVFSGTHYALLRIKSNYSEFDAITNSGKILKIKAACNKKGDCAVLYKSKKSIQKKITRTPLGSL